MTATPLRRAGGPRTVRGPLRPSRTRPAANRVVPYAFVLPAVLFFVCFLLLPIGYTVYLSLQKTHVVGLGLGANSRTQVFAGLSNYASALSDPALLSGALRVLVYGCILVPIMLGLALLFALLLDARRVRLARFSRIAIFLPYAVPVVISSLLWGFLYLPAVSPIVDLLHALSLPAPDMFNQRTLLFSVANIGIWGGTGFNMIVIHTSLRAVPQEMYEAARLDGASEAQIALRIKIPLVTPALILTAVFSVIATLQVFTEPEALRPLTNTMPYTWTPLMTVYLEAFQNNDIYSAAATSVVIAVVTLVISFVFLRLTSKRAFGQEAG